MEMPRHIMVDVETLGVGDNAPIIQIGACRFDWHTSDDAPEGVISAPGGEFRVHILASDWKNIEADTVLWWDRQDPLTRATVFDQRIAVSLGIAMDMFARWCERGGRVEGIWADSPNFYLRLMRQAWERTITWPWPFTHRQERCFRTIKKEFGHLSEEPLFVGTRHDALDDAMHQALWCANIMRKLGAA